jgi:hypothetical protein
VVQANSWELFCRSCKARTPFGLIEMDRMLRGLRLPRPDAQPDPDIVVELIKVAQPRLTCPYCGHQGLSLESTAGDSDENWGMARTCESCGKAIPAERIEVFPDTKLCMRCQSGEERGQSRDAPEYCPHCGTPMQLRQSTRPGITRYEMNCPSCRR